jgi:iron complex transport system ATP-binding protein
MSHQVLMAADLCIGYPSKFGPPKILSQDLNLELKAGQLVCLLGPNGSGKSTLLRTLSGLQPALGGQVWVKNRKLHTLSARELSRILGVVLTERLEVPNMRVYDLLSLGRYPYTDWTGRLKQSDHDVLSKIIRLTDLENLIHRELSELSDGERQKAMVARALAQEPDLVFLDEPTAFLDLPRRVELMGTLRNLAHSTKRCFLVSTHDLDLALRAADQLWLLSPEGKVYSGIPEVLALQGSFAKVFSGRGVEFNDETGSFEIIRHPHSKISLKGEGKARFWTARALEREGYEIQSNPMGKQLQILPINSGWLWKLNDSQSKAEFTSLEDLLIHLNGL